MYEYQVPDNLYYAHVRYSQPGAMAVYVVANQKASKMFSLSDKTMNRQRIRIISEKKSLMNRL